MTDTLHFGPYTLHAAARLLERDGCRVELGSRAFDLLYVLAAHGGRVVSKRELLARAWGGVTVEENSLRVHIAALRKALDDGRYVVNVAGQGYSFVAPVRRAGPGTMPGSALQALPPAPARLVGRDEELAATRERLLARRFVTITGPGGMGKTSLALALAHAMAEPFPGGRCFVDLASLAVPAQLPATVAEALGAAGAADRAAALERGIGTRRMLLVLDNCEHLADAAAALAERLVRECPGLHLLATSREALRAEGEHVYRLPPLACPDPGELTAVDAMRHPAIALFAERAAASGAGFVLSDTDAPAVALLCRRLDGIPLAIELGASRIGTYGLQATVRLLDHRFRLFWQGRRTALPRHRSLHATLDWSFRLLPPDEQDILCRLGVYAGRFTLDGAVAVAADEPAQRWHIIEAVGSLVAKSLAVTDSAGGTARYRLLYSTRVFAAARLVESGGWPAAARRHALHVQAMLETPILDDPAEQRAADTALLADARAALAWAFGGRGAPGAEPGTEPGGEPCIEPARAPGEPILAAALAAAVGPLLLRLSLLGECRRWCEAALASIPPPRPAHELALQESLAVAAMYSHGNDAVVDAATGRALALADATGDGAARLRLLVGRNIFLIRAGRFRAAQELAAQADATARALGTPAALAIGAWTLGMSCNLRGDHASARHHLARGMAIASGHAFPTLLFGCCLRTGAVTALARTLWMQGDSSAALALARDTVAATAQLDHVVTACIALVYNASIFLWAGDTVTAAEQLNRLDELAAAHDLGPYAAAALGLRGDLLCREGDSAGGISLLRRGLRQLDDNQYQILRAPLGRALAEALAGCGLVDEAMAAIDEAMACIGDEEGFDTAELLGTAGLVRLRAGDGTAGRDLLARALDCARRQGALASEQRLLQAMQAVGIPAQNR